MTKQKPTLFSKTPCVPCARMKRVLQNLNIDYEEVDAFNPDGTFNRRFRDFADGKGIMSVPVLATGPDTFTTMPTTEAVLRVTTR